MSRLHMPHPNKHPLNIGSIGIHALIGMDVA